MTESALLSAVIELAQWRKFRVHHCRPARMQSGKWATPIQGDPGFPDIVLAGHGRLLFIECKDDKGELSKAQQAWAAELLDAKAEWWRFRPEHWTNGTIARILAMKTP